MRTMKKTGKKTQSRTTVAELTMLATALHEVDPEQFASLQQSMQRRLDEHRARAAGSTPPIDVSPLPPEVEASIAEFGRDFARDDPSDADGHSLRELIAHYRAAPPPMLAPITEAEIARLCKRFPSTSIFIFGSRLFAEAVRAVTALLDSGDQDLQEEFNYWREIGEDNGGGE